MNLIHVLPDHVKSRIAAGEVIERPANVVKELVENAIDAGAAHVIIDVAGGGKRLIRVSDDGEGMTRDDLSMAVRRHATSKIRNETDIYRIATMGFRGEALPSIGSVSEMVISTKSADADTGWRLIMIGGDLSGPPEPCSCANGTTVEVRDLFVHVPARLKFLSSATGEASRIVNWVMRLALAKPDIGLKLIVDGTVRISAPACTDARERVRRIYGDDLVKHLIDVDYDEPTLTTPASAENDYIAERLTGLIGPPDTTYHNRTRLMLFVNGRPVHDKLLTAAVQDAFKNRLPARRYPVGFLHLTVDPREIDINVHPTKDEVRFLRDRFIFGFIRKGILAALDGTPRLIKHSHSGGVPTPHPSPANTPTPDAIRPLIPKQRDGEPPPAFNAFSVGHAPSGHAAGSSASASYPSSVAEPPFTVDTHRTSSPVPPAFNPGETARAPDGVSSSPARDESLHFDKPVSRPRVIGQLHAMFIVAENDDGLEIIDQHALHERILFERFSAAARRGEVDVQPALIPVTVDLTPAQAVALPEIADACKSFGLEVDELNGTAVIRTVPVGVQWDAASDALMTFLDEYADTGIGRADPFRLRERAIYWTSCKSAIKAGDRLDISEMEHLLDEYHRLCGAFGYTCPHGRPISMRVSSAEIKRAVGRE